MPAGGDHFAEMIVLPVTMRRSLTAVDPGIVFVLLILSGDCFGESSWRRIA
jgi:hypothetical protein